MRQTLYGYVAFYNGKRTEIYAESLSKARDMAEVFYRPPKSKRHMISVLLAEKDGEPVIHTPDF